MSTFNIYFFTQWRDHWMQAVYFLKRPLLIQAGNFVTTLERGTK